MVCGAIRPIAVGQLSPDRSAPQIRVLKIEALLSGHWRPHPTGHEGTVEIAVQFGWTRTHLPSFNDRYFASELRVTPSPPGHEPSFNEW